MRAEVLDAAADLIDREGWNQGNGGACTIIDGSCAATAVHKAVVRALPDPTITELWERIDASLAALVSALGGDDNSAIWAWNDTPGRTKDEVTAMLRAVAATLRVAESTVVPSDCVDAAQMEQVLP